MVSSLAQAITTYETIALSNGLSPRTVEWVTASARLLQGFLGEDTAPEAITPPGCAALGHGPAPAPRLG